MARAAFKWKPEYCDLMIEFMDRGYSLKAFAGEIGVDQTTMTEWGRTYPDFEQALQIARAKRCKFWETKLIDIAEGGDGNVAAPIFALKNANPEEFGERFAVPTDGTALGILADDTGLARAVAFLLHRASAKTPEPLTIEGTKNGAGTG